jgi:NADH-quinone oxidoreductase subunit N
VEGIFERVNPDLTLLIPHLIVLGLAFVLLAADIILPRARHAMLTWLTLAGFVAALVANFFYMGENRSTFSEMFRADDFAVFINLVVLTGAILSVLVSSSYLQRMESPGSMPLAEYYVLLSFSVLGTMIVGRRSDHGLSRN